MKIQVIAVLAAATALASCTTDRERPLPVAPQQVSIEGAWSDPNGLMSTFQAGAFNTRTTDSNQLLASGTYAKMPGDNLYQINMTSHVQNKQSRVNCALISPVQLNCTADSGAQFTLTRKQAGF